MEIHRRDAARIDTALGPDLESCLYEACIELRGIIVLIVHSPKVTIVIDFMDLMQTSRDARGRNKLPPYSFSATKRRCQQVNSRDLPSP